MSELEDIANTANPIEAEKKGYSTVTDVVEAMKGVYQKAEENLVNYNAKVNELKKVYEEMEQIAGVFEVAADEFNKTAQNINTNYKSCEETVDKSIKTATSYIPELSDFKI